MTYTQSRRGFLRHAALGSSLHFPGVRRSFGAAGFFFTAFGGSYPAVGTTAALIYRLGMLAIWFAPDTTKQSLAR